MHIKTILNQIYPIKGFIYKEFCITKTSNPQIEIIIKPDGRIRPICSFCEKSCSTYDTSLRPRRFQFVPLWHMVVTFVYCMRRVNCPRCGVKVERVPWSDGKHHTTFALRIFLANWSKDLSWKRVVEHFGTSWETVYRSVR
jgi:transposase